MSQKTFNNNISYRLKEDLESSFNELDDILTNHAGPFATDCVIGSKWRQVNDIDEFTKDGIKILCHLIVSEDAADRFAVRMARFIGIAVDKRCHDGTTTSMLLFCRLALWSISQMNDNFLNSRERYVRKERVKAILEKCLSILEDIKVTEDDIYELAVAQGMTDVTHEDIREAMAFHMAMISSKGDYDLSRKIGKLIRSAPRKIYGMFRDTPLAIETKEKYILKKQECDISFDGMIGNFQDYNHRSDTQYFSENAVLFVTPNDIVGRSMESMYLNAFISTNAKTRLDLSFFGGGDNWETLCEGKKNLIILTPLLNDPELIEIINEFNRTHINCKISWFNVQIPQRMKTSWNWAIHYMASVPTFADAIDNATASLIGLKPDQKVTFRNIGKGIEVKGLYEKGEGVYHPLFVDSTPFPKYGEFVKETEDLIEFAQSNITNPALDPDEVAYLTMIYRAATCQEIYDIEIGGSSHEQYANRTVYEDAVGAALSAINEGVVFGGYAQLSRIIYSSTDSDEQTVSDIIAGIVADSMRCDIAKVVGTIPDVHDKWGYIAADPKKFFEGEEDFIFFKSFKDELEYFLSLEDGEPILIQAWGGYDEQFKRFRNILPMLANTTNLVDMRTQDGDSVR